MTNAGATATQAGRLPETRSRTLAFVGLLLGGLFCLIAGSQPWWRARGDGTSSFTPVTFSGVDASAGLTQALGVVGLVGGVLGLALRTLGRRILALLLAANGAAVVVIGVLRLRPGVSAVQDKVRQVSLTDDYTLDPTGWNFGYAAAGVFILSAALLMLTRAGRWPTRADRFRRQAELSAAGEAAALVSDPALWWKAQDAGTDPTLPIGPRVKPAEADEHASQDAVEGERERHRDRESSPDRDVGRA